MHSVAISSLALLASTMIGSAYAAPPACLLACAAQVAKSSSSQCDSVREIDCFCSKESSAIQSCLDSICPSGDSESAYSFFSETVCGGNVSSSSAAPKSSSSSAASSSASSSSSAAPESSSVAPTTESSSSSSVAPESSSVAPTTESSSSVAPTTSSTVPTTTTSSSVPVVSSTLETSSVVPSSSSIPVISSMENGVAGSLAPAAIAGVFAGAVALLM